MLASHEETELRPRVLLVDDDDAVRNSLYAVLENEGYEVLAASNGADGLAIYNQSIDPIELLVTDYNMPQMSGLELARECTRAHRELGVLYVSGSEPDEELQEDLQGRKRDFLAKPFRGADLLRKARELLLFDSIQSVSCPRNGDRQPLSRGFDGESRVAPVDAKASMMEQPVRPR